MSRFRGSGFIGFRVSVVRFGAFGVTRLGASGFRIPGVLGALGLELLGFVGSFEAGTHEPFPSFLPPRERRQVLICFVFSGLGFRV